MESVVIHRASADGSEGYAQDDETGAAMESEGMHRANAEGSIGSSGSMPADSFMLRINIDLWHWPYVSRPLEKGRPIGPDRNAP